MDPDPARPDPGPERDIRVERQIGEQIDESIRRRLDRRTAESARQSLWADLLERYLADPGPTNARLYVAHHPIFLTWAAIPDEVAQAAVTGYFCDHDYETLITEGDYAEPRGLELMQVLSVAGHDPASAVTLQHGPVLWPLNRPAFAYFLEANGTQVIDSELEVTAVSMDVGITRLAERIRRRYGNDRKRLDSNGDDPVVIALR